jgi:hypothetical protein
LSDFEYAERKVSRVDSASNLANSDILSLFKKVAGGCTQKFLAHLDDHLGCLN